MRRVLIIEDEPGLVMALTQRLTSEGYTVETSADGESGLERATADTFDIIVLHLMLPLKSGFDVCRDLRQRGINTPIIMLTARGQVVDRVLGLKIGADDYLTKPFEMMELMARVEALLRRAPISQNGQNNVYEFGPLRIDLRGTSVSRNGRIVPLSAREFQLLRYFVEHRGATLSRDILLKEVWGYNADAFTRTVDVHVASLRQKLEKDPKQPSLIVTVLGLGYKFVA